MPANHPDEIMARVAAAARSYRATDARGEPTLPDPLPPMGTGAAPRTVPRHPTVGLHELLALRGADLVRSAYERLLWRPAGPDEVAVRTEQLRSGRQDPFTLIHDLSVSSEGRACTVRVTACGWRRAIFAVLRLPKGRTLWLALRLLLSLPRLRLDAAAADRDLERRLERIEHALGGLGPQAASTPEAALALRRRIQMLERRIALLEQQAPAGLR